jgi:hypothetical protein
MRINFKCFFLYVIDNGVSNEKVRSGNDHSFNHISWAAEHALASSFSLQQMTPFTATAC